MEKGKKHFLVWKDNNEDEGGYYSQYDTIEEAVGSVDEGTAVEVFAVTPKRLGIFKRQTVCVKVEEKKPRAKRKFKVRKGSKK